MKNMKEKNINVIEVVTDAHFQIGASMKKNYKDVKHSHDIWHAAKNLGKKIIAGMWCSVLHHAVDEHEWLLPYSSSGTYECDHGPLQEEGDTQWLVKGSPAHVALRKIVLDKRFLNNIHYYLNFRSTAELENFHQLILMYVAKRFAYNPSVYQARNQLAALDYNVNVDRPYKMKKDGTIRYKRIFNKKSGRWTVVGVREPKSYAHVQELFFQILLTRMEDKEGLMGKRQMEASDPRLISATIAPVTPPPTSQLMQEKKYRGQ